jgi:beta-lactamase regulating signal transducer with metallopeptidase domain
MAAELTDLLIRSTLGASLAILLVLGLRLPIRRMFGARAGYRAWVIVPLAALASMAPPPRLDIYSDLPKTMEPALEAAAGLAAGTYWPWLTLLWAAGALLCGLVMAFRQHRFLKALGRPNLDEDGLPLLHALDGSAIGPAVVGAFNPRIVLPANFAARYTDEERRLVLAHERAHLFAHHAQVNALGALLLCLNWFNPLAYIASRLMRIDQELATDAAVVAQFPKGQRAYAEAILKTQMAALSLPLGCQWPTRAGHPLRERIALMARPGSGKATSPLGAAAIGALCLATGAAAWAAQPPAGMFAAGDQSGRLVEVWTMLKSPNGQPPSGANHLFVASGGKVARRYKLPDGSSIAVSMSPRLEGEVVSLAIEVRSGEAVLAQRGFRLHDGEPAVIRLKDAGLVVTARPRDSFWTARRG